MRSAAHCLALTLLLAALAGITLGCGSAPVRETGPVAEGGFETPTQPDSYGEEETTAPDEEAPLPEGGAKRELSVSEETHRIMEVFGVEEGARKETAERFYRSGLNLYRQLRYQEAAHDLRIAARLDPQHEKARTLLFEVLWILGERKGEVHDVARQLVQERLTAIQQAQAEMERVYVEARRLFDDKEFEASIQRFERVLEIIRWFPHFIDKKGYEDAAKFWIGLARIEAAEKKAFVRHRQEEIVQQRREHEQAQDYRYAQAKIKSLMEKAKDAIMREKYSRAEGLLDKVLKVDPRYDEAMRLRAYAVKHRHLKNSLRNIYNKVEELKRAMENVNTVAIPYTDLVMWPKESDWEIISQRQIPILAMIKEEESPAVIKIKSKLENQKVTINFSDTNFEEAINFLRDITGLNFVISNSASELVTDKTVTLRLREIRLKNALALILASDPSLKWSIKHDVIYISTEEAEPPELFLEFYNISEIVQKVPDFPAPQIALSDIAEPWKPDSASGGGGGGVIDLGDDDDDEDTVGAGFDWAKLEELIEQMLGEDDEGEIRYAKGLLIVRKSLEAHKKIQKLLATLRKTVGIMVTVEARFIDIQDNFLESLGVDWKDLPFSINDIDGPGPPGVGGTDINAGYQYSTVGNDGVIQNEVRGSVRQILSLPVAAGFPFNMSDIGGLAVQYNFAQDYQVQAILDAVSKSYKSNELTAPRITVFNTQRSHILAIYQEAYLADLDIEITMVPAIVPVIGILKHGSILEAKPVVTHDKKYVLLEIKPTMGVDLTGLTTDRAGRRMVLQGGLTSVDIELPTISLTKIRTTVVVPDGGTVIIGGLKNMLDYEGQTNIPLIGRIPLIKNLFRKKGRMRLRRSLIVLLRADISILREKEQQLFGTSSW